MKKILIIDDYPFIKDQIYMLLHNYKDIEIKQLLDPYNTRKIIDEFKPDLVILDIEFNLPISGYELGLFIIKEYNIPIVIFTGSDNNFNTEKLKPIGILNKYIIDNDDMKIQLKNIMKKLNWEI